MSTHVIARRITRRVAVPRRFRLDRFEHGSWTEGRHYDTFDEAFDAGLLWATGQIEEPLPSPPGIDFRVVPEWIVEQKPPTSS